MKIHSKPELCRYPEDYAQGRIDAVIKKPFAITEVLECATELLNKTAARESLSVEMPA